MKIQMIVDPDFSFGPSFLKRLCDVKAGHFNVQNQSFPNTTVEKITYVASNLAVMVLTMDTRYDGKTIVLELLGKRSEVKGKVIKVFAEVGYKVLRFIKLVYTKDTQISRHLEGKFEYFTIYESTFSSAMQRDMDRLELYDSEDYSALFK